MESFYVVHGRTSARLLIEHGGGGYTPGKRGPHVTYRRVLCILHGVILCCPRKDVRKAADGAVNDPVSMGLAMMTRGSTSLDGILACSMSGTAHQALTPLPPPRPGPNPMYIRP